MIYKLTFVARSNLDEDRMRELANEMESELSLHMLDQEDDEDIKLADVEDITDSATRENTELTELLDS